MSFGETLKKLRQDQNLTQEELAKKINSSRSNIANYENNNNMPSVDILERLSVIFNVSVDYLLGKSETIKLSKEDINFMNSIKKLDENDKILIKNMMEALLDKQEKNENEEK